MEEWVFTAIDRFAEELGDLATDERVRLDIAAYALNHLPPKYAVSVRGEVLSRFNADSPQFQAELTTVVMRAIHHVKSNPKNQPKT